jgi:hypothetical protein
LVKYSYLWMVFFLLLYSVVGCKKPDTISLTPKQKGAVVSLGSEMMGKKYRTCGKWKPAVLAGRGDGRVRFTVEVCLDPVAATGMPQDPNCRYSQIAVSPR